MDQRRLDVPVLFVSRLRIEEGDFGGRTFLIPECDLTHSRRSRRHGNACFIYHSVNPSGAETIGWGIPMANDIAFAVGILVLLSRRIPRSLIIFW